MLSEKENLKKKLQKIKLKASKLPRDHLKSHKIICKKS
jgi:hypothetical protein